MSIALQFCTDHLHVRVRPICEGESVVLQALMIATQNMSIAPQKSSRIASHL
jgi:hypothetical protein